MKPFRLHDVLAGAFQVEAPIAPSTWAENNLRLPTSSNAISGPLKLASYQRQMIDLAADPAIHTAVFMLASQIGKSLAIDALLSYFIARDPGPMLLTHPSEGKALEWMRDRFGPLCAVSPTMRRLISGGRGNTGNGLRHKQFAGGHLNVASSHKPDDLAAKSIRYAIFDEIERFAQSAGKEGDPVALGIKRTQLYALNKKIIIASTPTIRGGRIGQWFARGDQQRFMVCCPECKDSNRIFEPYTIDMLTWTPNKPQTAYLGCPHCTHHISDKERKAAVDAGFWNATTYESEPGIISFHANVLISPFVTLGDIASDYEDAKKSPAKWRVFCNTSLAEDFEDEEAEQLDAEALMARAEKIRSPYPADVQFVSIGCDVQWNRLEYSILLNCKAGVSVVANHVAIIGDTSSDVPWIAFDADLGQKFRTVDGRELPVEITAVDSSDSTTRVYDFVAAQRTKNRRIFAIKGVSGFDKPITRFGSRARGTGPRIVLVGVDVVKFNLYARLRMSAFGPGYIHLPDHLGLEYFQGVASEKIIVRQVRGFDRREFFKVVRLNEPLDALVYATAAASMVKVPRSTNEATSAKPKLADIAARLHAANNPNGAH